LANENGFGPKDLDKLLATVNQHPPVHHEGWMVNDYETIFCWVPVPYPTMVVISVTFFL
jgi:hypothetical protein